MLTHGSAYFLLLVILCASDIRVYGGGVRSFRFHRLAVQPLLQDGLDALIVEGTDSHRPLAGILQPLWRVAFGQPHHPQAGPEALPAL